MGTLLALIALLAVEPNFKDFAYPPLARQIRITGTVKLNVMLTASGVTQISIVGGHPLLAGPAHENLHPGRGLLVTISSRLITNSTLSDLSTPRSAF